MPEMYFGENIVEIENVGLSCSIKFTAANALKDWTKAPSLPNVYSQKHPHPDQRTTIDDLQVSHNTFDWTFTSFYQGTLSEHLKFVDSEEKIDYDLLKQRDPILCYDDVPLYEDELHDLGTSAFSIKFRVMPTCFFVLARFWARVDGHDGFCRAFETRLFHRFGSKTLVRESVYKENTNAELYARHTADPTFYLDPNKVIPLLDTRKQANEAAQL